MPMSDREFNMLKRSPEGCGSPQCDGTCEGNWGMPERSWAYPSSQPSQVPYSSNTSSYWASSATYRGPRDPDLERRQLEAYIQTESQKTKGCCSIS